MAPTAVSPRAPLYFGLALLVAVAGFFPSYFAVLRTTDTVRHFHGLSALAWMGLLVLQASLFRLGRLDLHRRIGKLSPLLVALFLLSGLLIVRSMLQARTGFSRAFGVQLAAVDLLSLVGFAAAYLLALHHRRTLRLHARWMAVTALLVLPPALARLLPMLLPAIHSFEAAFHGSFLLTEALVLYMVWVDRREASPVQVPYRSLLALLALQQGLFWALPHLR